MIRKALVASAVLLLVLSIGSVASAQSDCSKIVPASPWGPALGVFFHQAGPTNFVF